MKTLPRLPEDFIKNLPGSKVKLIYKLMKLESEVLAEESKLSSALASYYWSLNPNLKSVSKSRFLLPKMLKSFEAKKMEYLNLLDACASQIDGWYEAISPKLVEKKPSKALILGENITRKHARSLKTKKTKVS